MLDGDEFDPTPWLDSPVITDDCATEGCMCVDSCTVIFLGCQEPPLRFHPKCNATVGQFLIAHQALVGDLQIAAIKWNGENIGPDHVMEVAQVIQIQLSEHVEGTYHQGHEIQTVSPTIEWAAVTPDLPVSPPRKMPRRSFDIGDCPIPDVATVSEDSWLDATPLLGLQGQQYKKLLPPSIQTPQQLWSVKHQYLKCDDRLAVLNQQDNLWADDEIRHHLHALVTQITTPLLKNGLQVPGIHVIDPLLSTVWVQNRGFDCSKWANDHPEILQESKIVITVVLHHGHWIPLFMSPLQGILHVYSWDAPDADHSAIAKFVKHLAVCMG